MRRVRVRAAGAVVAALALVASGCSSSVRSSSARSTSARSATGPGPTGERTIDIGPQGRRGQFVVECTFSHFGTDDPIVHPGEHHASHLHVFFGNTTTDASSTVATLAAGATTCDQPLDRAAYWAPALLDGDTPIEPVKVVAYYRAGPGIDPAALVPYPLGLAMVAGEAQAPAPQSSGVVAWSCGAGSSQTAVPMTCDGVSDLTLSVVFPDCWDGVHLDSADHRSHVAYSLAGVCPVGYPAPVPELTVSLVYPPGLASSRLTLASGSIYGGHADFLNAWDEERLALEVVTCLHRAVVCDVAS